MLATKSLRSGVPWLLTVIVLATIGMSGDMFLLSVATTTVLWIVLGGGLNLVMGYGGLANLGIGASYGIGAYTAAVIATRTDLPLVVAVVGAVIAAAVVALVIAPLVLRTRGLHFAIATLATGIVATDLFTNLDGITGGAVGLSGIERPAALESPVSMYWFTVLVGLVALVLFAAFHHSRLALVLRGARDDEQLTRSLGYRVAAYKVTAYVLGAAAAGLAGALYTYFIQYVEPSGFALAGASFQVFAIVAFGGAASLWGPVVGAILLTGVPTFVDMDPQLKMLAYGLALLIVVLAVPEGVVPGCRRLADRVLGRRHRTPDTAGAFPPSNPADARSSTQSGDQPLIVPDPSIRATTLRGRS